MKDVVNEFAVNGINITARTIGEGKRAVLMLPGLGSPSGVEFKALAALLGEDYRIAAISFTGISESAQMTNAAITEGVHFAAGSLGIHEYILAAHSISGIYSLYYAKQYSDEIKAFVGIDCTPPEFVTRPELLEKNRQMCVSGRKRAGSALYRKIVEKSTAAMLKAAKGYEFSREDIAEYTQKTLLQLSGDVSINELSNAGKNMTEVLDAKFPESIPVLSLISTATSKREKCWEAWHERLSDNKKSRVVTLRGSHYLHISAAASAAETIKGFLDEIYREEI